LEVEITFTKVCLVTIGFVNAVSESHEAIAESFQIWFNTSYKTGFKPDLEVMR